MNDLRIVFSEAVRYHQQGLLQEARIGYLRVLEALPENVNVLGNMGLLCRDLGEPEEALNFCRRAAEAAPEDPNQHINLGAVHEPLGQIAEARACYEKALTLVPGHPKALNNLGKLLHLLGDTEKGQALIQKSLAIEPSSPQALNNLGVILSGKGDIRSAITCIERSLLLDPTNIETMYNLAGLYNCEGENAKAVELLERLLKFSPGHGSASHMLAALTGQAPPAAPPQYVTETFDKYAGRFDHHLLHVLGYTVPAALAEMTDAHSSGRRFSHGLDLGCGTGLSGEPFHGLAERLTGVDLSSLMLRQAEAKKIYHRLECREILQFLESDRQRYDLFVAADVFIYLGRLEPFFLHVAKLAEPGALLACSTERCTGKGDYSLRTSGRYAHSPGYILSLAESFGFSPRLHREHDIRKEQGSWIPGDLYLLEKADAN